MPINPEIALGVKQFEMPDPLTAYAKVAAIKDAQSRNALSQLEFAKAQREEATTNALNEVYRASVNPETGEVDYGGAINKLAQGGFGSSIPALEEFRLKNKTAATNAAKADEELFKTKLTSARSALDFINPNDPAAPQQYAEYLRSVYADKILGPRLTAMGASADKSFATLSNAVQTGKFAEFFQQSVLGIEKTIQNQIEQNKPTDFGRTLIAAGYAEGSPEYKQLMQRKIDLDSTRAPTEADRPSANVRDAQWYMNASDKEREAFDLANRPSDSNKPPSGYRYGEDGNLVAIPGGPGDVKVIGAAAEARRNSELKPPPAPVSKALLENNQNLRKARDALTLIQGGTVGALQGDPSATGYKGFLPDVVLQRMDPAGVDTRAAIADLGSMIIHDRSGAAVTASEYPRLVPFIPRDRDDPPVIEKKLQRFVQEYEAIQKDYADMYSEDQGYRLPKSLTGGRGNDIPPAPPGVDPEDWQSMTDKERSAWPSQ
jgi:hypothetical protein